jgi:hypothetical protein
MGIDVQVNPMADSLRISPELYEILEPYLEEFEIWYVGIQPSAALTKALRTHAPRDKDEARVIRELLEVLERNDSVGMLISA